MHSRPVRQRTARAAGAACGLLRLRAACGSHSLEPCHHSQMASAASKEPAGGGILDAPGAEFVPTDEDFAIEFEAPLVRWPEACAPPPFHRWEEVYPYLGPVRRFRKALLAEVMGKDSACRWVEWPETGLYKPDDPAAADEGAAQADWRVIPLVYTFPANDPAATVWVERECSRLPLATRLLRAIPGIRTALFSRLGPGTRLAAHRGWASLANHVLRCHLALSVPGPRTCGVMVEGKVQWHEEGKIIVFDDSKAHSAFNNHETESRTVLIFDIARPEGLGEGEATGGETHELQEFIKAFMSGRA